MLTAVFAEDACGTVHVRDIATLLKCIAGKLVFGRGKALGTQAEVVVTANPRGDSAVIELQLLLQA